MSTVKECMECSRPSDNKSFNCPPRMADGRHFTDYRPRCLSNFVQPNDQPMNSYEYRQYLIHNADKLMQNNRLTAYNVNMCGPCVEPYDIGTMLPEQNMIACDANTCRMYLNDQNGVGTGRQYMTEQASKSSRTEFLRAKQNEQNYMKQNNNCCTTADDDLKYYPWDGGVYDEMSRLTVPGGGVAMTGGDRM